MQICSLDEVSSLAHPRSVALGFFDGLHIGHQALVRRAVQHAPQGGESAVFTFPQHPLQLLRPESAPGLLTTLDEKIPLLAGLGVDRLILGEFTAAFAALEPLEFVREILHEHLRAQVVVVGPNYRFGRGAQGTPQALRDLAPALGIEVEEMLPVELDSSLVSSTRIREAVLAGRLGEAHALLGRPYGFAGEVVHGDQRGRTIGFPTANLRPQPAKLLPPDGVYAVSFCWEGRCLGGVANLGVRPTFGLSERLLEVHVLDFSGDLYGRRADVWFHERLRPEQRFASLEALKEQICCDVQAAREVLSGNGLAVDARAGEVVSGPGAGGEQLD